jgi:hypothetical protein
LWRNPAVDDEAGAGHKAGIGEARKTTPLAMSVTVPMRPIGSRFVVTIILHLFTICYESAD